MKSETYSVGIVILLLTCGCGKVEAPLNNSDGGYWTDTSSSTDGSSDDPDVEFVPNEDVLGPGSLCLEGTPDLFNNSHSPHVGGLDSVDLVVDHFEYFRCPHCASFTSKYTEVWSARPDLMSRVRVFFHHYPFNNETARQIHAATVAAAAQGEEYFWALHDHLYFEGSLAEEQVYWTPEELVEYAEEIGLDMEQFHADMNDEMTFAYLAWDKSQAQAQGATGTPSVYVCGEKISWASIETVVDSYLDGSAEE